MSVETYMSLCLHDPAEGYYATHPGLGAAGDFITAPLVSQMFGELLGVWAIETWVRLGRPDSLRLVEIGPGDGTLFADCLRVIRASTDFQAACEPWLVETSAPLRTLQGQALSRGPRPIRWATTLADIPDDAPMIIIGNEFLDCLPIRQTVWTGQSWVERNIGIDDGRTTSATLRFVTGPPRPDVSPAAAVGTVREDSAALAAFGKAVGALIARVGGAALFIDYGRDASGFGDTLQALRNHRKEHPLANPGLADLTAHVDFPAFLAAAGWAGAETGPILTQASFLRALGIETRANALVGKNPDAAGLIDRQLQRLIAADRMGALFKAVCIHSAGLTPPAFEART